MCVQEKQKRDLVNVTFHSNIYMPSLYTVLNALFRYLTYYHNAILPTPWVVLFGPNPCRLHFIFFDINIYMECWKK